MISRRHPQGRRLVRSALVVVLTSLLSFLLVAPAQADPSLSELRQQATELRQQLDELAVKQQLAVEEYDEAQQALDVATTNQVLATTQLQDAKRSADGAMSASAQRARAIYMSGGRVGIAATVLEATSINDVLSRWRALQTIVRADATAVQLSDTVVVDSEQRADDAEEARAQTRDRQARASRALARLQATLQEQKDLLADADARVVELAETQRRQAEEAARLQAEQLAQQAGIGVSWDASALPAAPNAVAARAIAFAKTRLGSPYVWGAVGPSTFDCSGLTMWAYRQAGLNIPRTSRQQYAALPRVPLSQLAPGDLVFYATDVTNPATIHHVGMYLGAGLSIYAPQTGDVVKIGAVGYGRIIGAARPVGW